MEYRKLDFSKINKKHPNIKMSNLYITLASRGLFYNPNKWEKIYGDDYNSNPYPISMYEIGSYWCSIREEIAIFMRDRNGKFFCAPDWTNFGEIDGVYSTGDSGGDTIINKNGPPRINGEDLIKAFNIAIYRYKYLHMGNDFGEYKVIYPWYDYSMDERFDFNDEDYLIWEEVADTKFQKRNFHQYTIKDAEKGWKNKNMYLEDKWKEKCSSFSGETFSLENKDIFHIAHDCPWTLLYKQKQEELYEQQRERRMVFR